MELTAQNLQEVTFGTRVKGYDPGEVDDFIEVVAEGVEELRERLRRVTERATRAEEQLAEGGGSSAPVAVAAPNPSAEITKVWERAAAAAEAAVSEAQADAQRLLADAQAQVDRQLAEAHQQAESERSSAHNEAQATISQARDEAARLASESQGQLRAEITQLEQARNHLKESVDELTSYLDSELSRVRSVLADAMGAIDSRAIGASTPPEVGEVEVPPLPDYLTTDDANSEVTHHYSDDVAAATDEVAGSTSPATNSDSSWGSSAAPAAPGEVEGIWADPVPQDESLGGQTVATGWDDQPQSGALTVPASWDDEPVTSGQGQNSEDAQLATDDVHANNGAGAAPSDWNTATAPSETEWGTGQEQQGDWGTAPAQQTDWGNPQEQNSWGSTGSQGWGSTASQSGWGQTNGTDDESDPFLAELRRAVHDDEPLGPRNNGDTAINSLYADDDGASDEGDDKNGFFRRKK